jgi:polyisoprenyl-teichoic acid--peptidoglycan teichoic acid transferase
LDEDLIDPTYKVKNNGIWSTLYYRKGTHHLDGVAALRVARSRHGSDDFDRSKRQQLVIRAVFDQMRSINAGDISKVYDFVSTVFSYIDTNLNTADIVKNFLMYKDNEIADPNIINTDNILYATYTNLYLLSEQEKADVLKNDDFYKGLWIVLPRDNNWNLIKKHIENILR